MVVFEIVTLPPCTTGRPRTRPDGGGVGVVLFEMVTRRRTYTPPPVGADPTATAEALAIMVLTRRTLLSFTCIPPPAAPASEDATQPTTRLSTSVTRL